MGDHKKRFYCKIIDKERTLPKVKAVFFSLFNKFFFRFSLFPGIFALRRSGRKKLPMFQMQKAHNPPSLCYNTETRLVASAFPLTVIDNCS